MGHRLGVRGVGDEGGENVIILDLGEVDHVGGDFDVVELRLFHLFEFSEILLLFLILLVEEFGIFFFPVEDFLSFLLVNL